jgi:hypothetical protein
MFEESQDYAESQGRPLSKLCEEGLRLARAGAKDPAELALFLEDLAQSVERDNWDKVLCVETLRRKAEHLRGLARLVLPSVRAAPTAPTTMPMPKIEIKRVGGYDPRLGPKHPDNLDPTLGGYESTLTSLGWSPEQIAAEKQRRAVAKERKP